VPYLNMDNCTPRDHQLSFRILRTLDMKDTSIDHAQRRSLSKPHTESRWPRYVGLSREPGGEAQGHNIAEASGGTGVVACRIDARRTPQRTPRILL
jgi:hypothetical protein